MLDQLAQIDHAVELRDAIALQQGGFDLLDIGHGVVGGVAELAAGAFALQTRLHHGGEGLFVLVQGLQLLFYQGLVIGLLDQGLGRFQAVVQLREQAGDRVLSLIHI